MVSARRESALNGELRTPRTRLRAWRTSDMAALAAMNADAEVMQHFPAPLNAAQSAELVVRIQDHFEREGFGLWVLEIPGVMEFAGFVGLLRVSFAAPFTPATEIGWRLVRAAWGHGYASEAAQAALGYAFNREQLEEVVSFTVPDNHRSQAVMQRIGMHCDRSEDFDHPGLAPGHPLQRHVLYRIRRAEWLARADANRLTDISDISELRG